MASPFSAVTGEEQVEMAEGSQPTDVAFQLSQMQQVITDLQAQVVSLRGTERADLEHRLSTHLETRLSQTQADTLQAAQQAASVTAAVTGASNPKPPFKPKRPPVFKGNQDGPKIQEWLLQAEVYLRAMGIENHESCVFHISSFLEADAAVWWRHYYTQMELGLVVKPTTLLEMKVHAPVTRVSSVQSHHQSQGQVLRTSANM